MKKISFPAIAVATGLVGVLPAVAQDQLLRQGDETAMEMAQRVGACDGAGISDAEFVQDGGTVLRVECASGAVAMNGAFAGMAGGLGGSAPLIGSAAVLAAAVAASDSTGSTPNTP